MMSILLSSLILTILQLNFIFGAEIEFIVTRVPKYYTPLNDEIYLSGSFNSWNPKDPNYKMNKINANLFKLTVNLPSGTHLYKFTRGSWSSVECNENGSVMSNRILPVSGASLSIQHIISNWDDFKGVHSATGNVHIITNDYPYPQFNTTKRIWIYLPADYYTGTKSYSVIYMHDGQNLFDNLYSFIGEWGIDETMQNFYNNGKETSIVVGIETNRNRIEELTPFANAAYGGGKADLYVDFLINNLKPYIDQNFRTKPQREYTGIAGSSLGGLFSFYIGLKYQSIFSKIGVFSPSFWFNDKIYVFASNFIQQYSNMGFYFICGGQESTSMVPDMLRMVSQLKQQGFKQEIISEVVKQDGSHSEWFWKREFPLAYATLFF